MLDVAKCPLASIKPHPHPHPQPPMAAAADQQTKCKSAILREIRQVPGFVSLFSSVDNNCTRHNADLVSASLSTEQTSLALTSEYNMERCIR